MRGGGGQASSQPSSQPCGALLPECWKDAIPGLQR